MSQHCPHCRHRIGFGRLFCPECGALVGGQSHAVPPKKRNAKHHALRESWKALKSPESAKFHFMHLLFTGSIALFVAVTCAIGIYGFWFMYKSEISFASFLPADSTVLSLEVHTNDYLRSVRAWEHRFSSQHSLLSFERWRPDRDMFLHTLITDPEIAIGDHAGFALVKNGAAYEKVFMFKLRDLSGFDLSAPEAHAHSGTFTSNGSVYSYNLFGEYLIIASSDATLKMIGTALSDRLADSITYQQLRKEQFSKGPVQIFYKPADLYFALMEMNKVPWSYDLRYSLLSSLVQQTTASLSDLSVSDNNLVMDTVSIPAQDNLLAAETTASSSLLSMVSPADTVTFVGVNFGQSFLRAEQGLGMQSFKLTIPLQKLLDEVEERSAIDLKKELIPLLIGPYTVSFGNSLSDVRVSLVTDRTTAVKIIALVQKVLDAYAPYVDPIIQPFTLADGGTAQELIVNPETKALQSDQMSDDVMIRTFTIPHSELSVSFTYYRGALHASLHPDTIQRSVNTESPVHLTATPLHTASAGEYTVINSEKLSKILTVLSADTDVPETVNSDTPWSPLIARLNLLLKDFNFIVDTATYSWNGAVHRTYFL